MFPIYRTWIAIILLSTQIEAPGWKICDENSSITARSITQLTNVKDYRVL